MIEKLKNIPIDMNGKPSAVWLKINELVDAVNNQQILYNPRMPTGSYCGKNLHTKNKKGRTMTMSVSDNETQDLLKTICDKLDILIKMNKPITIKADLTDEDKLLCPFCQQELDYLAEDIYGNMYCPNCRDKNGFTYKASESIWQELICTRKALDKAKWWLHEIVESHRCTPISTAEMALKEIIEMEQKDK